MAKVAIRIAESALADLESIRTWYAEQDVPEVGERLIGEIVASIEALVDHPDMGRIVPEFDQCFLRELIRPPFRIVYRRDPAHVRVVRVWRCERLLELSSAVGCLVLVEHFEINARTPLSFLLPARRTHHSCKRTCGGDSRCVPGVTGSHPGYPPPTRGILL
jgi:plasmid stabilization system protein ParE